MQKIAAGEEVGLLAGIPVGLKDNLCTQAFPPPALLKFCRKLCAALRIHRDGALAAAGAIALGKTNLDEFAMGGSTENSAYAVTGNPWDPSRVPGGSSGGSAAAVAADECPIALGLRHWGLHPSARLAFVAWWG
jgi:aspartyl-tRNA(Asn)/glutamyl-tRNA(Gln) amidotransferase subunit A